ncbi:PREDICTED: developmental pluripotency-associated protein 4-like [Nanorana parkeri]|uniref:developmental pluripotency-associated protein 4-like n=1 Tax=Nanorana parkeri TaxID=125878 RepID=UPI00085466A8|nr:PREDICTED: developmental pluripotency-associated protein 4-like [Nanorana parkeri]
MPRKQKSTPLIMLDLTPSSVELMKRAQLQQYCKKLGLHGGGKNTDLIQRLQDHFKKPANSSQKSPRTPSPPPSPPPPPPPPQDAKNHPEPPGGRGWCVVHGQQLTYNHWFPLTLRCGRVCLTGRGSYTPLHLTPSSVSTPPGLQDNLICSDCMERNQEKESRLQQKSIIQDGSCPSTGQSTSMGTSRHRNKSGKFQPQEDPEYAKRVDELLDQMAAGHVDSQKVLQPIRPAVVHSPVGKQERSPIPINP